MKIHWFLPSAATGIVLGWLAYHFLAPTVPALPPGSYQVLKLNLADADGRPQPLQQWDGKLLVVNYWATWCPPCREEMPGFSRLQTRLSAKGVQFVGIGIDVPDKVRQFRDSKKINYPLLVGGLDVAGTSVELGNKQQALPFTAVFGRQRELIAVKLGQWSEADLERELQKALAR
jgi:thiol-disulfide isomerase/thioredoxin